MKSNRIERIDSEIQKHLANIISKLDNEEISSTIVSILKVETFADLSLSKIYISAYGDLDEKKKIVDILNNNKKTIRYKLAHLMRIKNVPDLLFIVDEFEEKSSRVLKLFETIESEIVDDGGESDE